MGRTGISPHALLKLHLFGELVEEGWGEFGYLVGSSQRGEAWRDIDVRVMLPLDEWRRLFHLAWAEERYQHPGWRAHMLAWSTLGQSLTGLPIDFQVEPNNDTPGPRNPIGIWRPREAVEPYAAILRRMFTFHPVMDARHAVRGDEEDHVCVSCGYPWPCPYVEARALLSGGTKDGR